MTMTMMFTIEVLLLVFLQWNLSYGLQTYYLIDIDHHPSLNTNYCSNSLIDGQFYRIPRQCQKHLQCHSYHCDEQSFRCVKIRETLCCLHRYFHRYCSKENPHQIKDQFRSLYFHISIEHGYCEINLERIEKLDRTYCLADHFEFVDHRIITTTTLPSRHRLASRTNRSLILENLTVKSSSIRFIPLTFSFLSTVMLQFVFE